MESHDFIGGNKRGREIIRSSKARDFRNIKVSIMTAYIPFSSLKQPQILADPKPKTLRIQPNN